MEAPIIVMIFIFVIVGILFFCGLIYICYKCLVYRETETSKVDTYGRAEYRIVSRDDVESSRTKGTHFDPSRNLDSQASWTPNTCKNQTEVKSMPYREPTNEIGFKSVPYRKQTNGIRFITPQPSFHHNNTTGISNSNFKASPPNKVLCQGVNVDIPKFHPHSSYNGQSSTVCRKPSTSNTSTSNFATSSASKKLNKGLGKNTQKLNPYSLHTKANKSSKKNTKKRISRNKAANVNANKKDKSRDILLPQEAIEKHILPGCTTKKQARSFSLKRIKKYPTSTNTVFNVEPCDFKKKGTRIVSNEQVQTWHYQRLVHKTGKATEKWSVVYKGLCLAIFDKNGHLLSDHSYKTSTNTQRNSVYGIVEE